MKRNLFLIAVLSIVSLYASAQQTKIGYTNTDYIISQMPEAKQIDSQVKAYEKQLSSKLQLTAQGFQQEVQKFQQEAENMTEEARNSRAKELEEMRNQLQQDQVEAEASLQRKQVELLQPVFDKIQTAIDKVATANGYTYVLSSDAGNMPILLHAPEKDNISDLVLKELGITPTSTSGTGTENSNN